jgi:thioredoxin-related protein
MKDIFFQNLLSLCCLICLILAAQSAHSFDDSEIFSIKHPHWFIESPFLDLPDALAASKAKGKKGLMILFTTQGCSYCDLFVKTSLGDPVIATEVQKHFDSMGLEIFDDNELVTPAGVETSIKAFAKQEKVGFSPSLLFFSNEDGVVKPVLRVIGYQSPERFKQILTFVSQEHYKSSTLKQYLKKTTAKKSTADVYPELKTDPLFVTPPYLLDRSRFAAEQPLMVIFEQTNCKYCKQFHTQVLTDIKVRNKLNKFEVVRLDIDDSKTPLIGPNGEKLTSQQWYESFSFTQTPAFVFFNQQGKEVLKTDALVLNQRLINSLNFVLDKAYEKGWNYQRFARSQAIKRRQGLIDE